MPEMKSLKYLLKWAQEMERFALNEEDKATESFPRALYASMANTYKQVIERIEEEINE